MPFQRPQWIKLAQWIIRVFLCQIQTCSFCFRSKIIFSKPLVRPTRHYFCTETELGLVSHQTRWIGNRGRTTWPNYTAGTASAAALPISRGLDLHHFFIMLHITGTAVCCNCECKKKVIRFCGKHLTFNSNEILTNSISIYRISFFFRFYSLWSTVPLISFPLLIYL